MLARLRPLEAGAGTGCVLIRGRQKDVECVAPELHAAEATARRLVLTDWGDELEQVVAVLAAADTDGDVAGVVQGDGATDGLAG